MNTPRALADWPLAERARICGVLTDVDDTLTTEGQLCAPARAALQALAQAGLPVLAVTGRPVGWSLPFLSGPDAWPVAAIVAENGAVALLPSQAEPGVIKRYTQDAATRAANHARLQAVAQRVLREVPGAQLAQDSAGRECDIAIDHSEFAHLEPAQVQDVVDIMRNEGLKASVSSIHINGWIGEHDKRSGARWAVLETTGRDLNEETERWVFIGDSSNDEALFAYLPHTVGVVNVRRFLPHMTHPPRYITQGERGAGFAELAQALLAAQPAQAAQRGRHNVQQDSGRAEPGQDKPQRASARGTSS
jgi:HAD superfamily hydrolase (TIGR01484 family)